MSEKDSVDPYVDIDVDYLLTLWRGEDEDDNATADAQEPAAEDEDRVVLAADDELDD